MGECLAAVLAANNARILASVSPLSSASAPLAENTVLATVSSSESVTSASASSIDVQHSSAAGGFRSGARVNLKRKALRGSVSAKPKRVKKAVSIENRMQGAADEDADEEDEEADEEDEEDEDHSNSSSRDSEDSSASSGSDTDDETEQNSAWWVEAIIEECWEYEPKARKAQRWVRQYEVSWKKSRKHAPLIVVAADVDGETRTGGLALWRLGKPAGARDPLCLSRFPMHSLQQTHQRRWAETSVSTLSCGAFFLKGFLIKL